MILLSFDDGSVTNTVVGKVICGSFKRRLVEFQIFPLNGAHSFIPIKF